MNTLTRWEGKWDPFKEMEDFHSRLSSILGRTFGRLPLRGETETEEGITVAQWAPLVDVTEHDKEYLIKIELPEVKKDDVKVTVEAGALSITGERKFQKEEKGIRYHRVERAYGHFSRSFSVPDDADAANVNAEFKDGVLRVHLAKTEKAKPKTIEVKVA